MPFVSYTNILEQDGNEDSLIFIQMYNLQIYELWKWLSYEIL